jgi:MoaA/NifB/PqqE/SkfB family radical SAM enzyme
MLLLCNYYVTYRCNSFCVFCHFADHNKFNNTTDAKLEDFISNIDQIVKFGIKFIDVTGGEPLLNKNIDEMVSYATNKKLKVSLTTNTLLYPKFAERLAGHVSLLHFSLDSPDEDEHNSIRRIDSFKSVLKSIEIARSLGEFPDILFTVTDDTYLKLPRMYELAQKHELVLMVNPVFSYFGNPGLSIKALDTIEEFIHGKNDIYMNKAYLHFRRDGGNKIEKPYCKAVSRVIVISPNNEILLPCYHFVQKTIKIDKSIENIRNSDEIKYYKSMEGRFSFCKGCTINCYFEPSFAIPVNYYAWHSISSKVKYGYQKLVRQKIKKKILKKTSGTKN